MADKDSLLSQITNSIRDLQQEGGVEKDTADSLTGMFSNSITFPPWCPR